jgi:hypothetical protein
MIGDCLKVKNMSPKLASKTIFSSLNVANTNHSLLTGSTRGREGAAIPTDTVTLDSLNLVQKNYARHAHNITDMKFMR